MKSTLILLGLMLATLMGPQVQGQSTEPIIVDVVMLKGGSKLSGTILKWDIHNLEFKLITGATITIARSEVVRVFQDIPFVPCEQPVMTKYKKDPKPYDFKEEGLYHTFSGFVNLSFLGGAGVHYSIGHRFNRLLSVGIGTGLESHDMGSGRNIIPIYAEARGFLVPRRISPYYALKLGYGVALNGEGNETLESKGGFHFSPEIGVRFGAGEVSYYLGAEYKIQNATFVNRGWTWNGEGTFTDRVSYRRFEFRTGLVF